LFILFYRTKAKQEQQIDQQNKMSIAINFGSSPEEIHSVGDLGEDIWDIIYTWKEIAEEQDAIQHIVNKFNKLSRRVLGIGTSGATGGLKYYQKDYCRENKIPMTYNGSGSYHATDDDVMVVAIVFNHFHRKMPSARNLPDHWKKRGLSRHLVKECWDQEDQNLFLIAKSFTDGYARTPERFLKSWVVGDIEYTGCLEFIQMGIDRRNEYYDRPDVIAALRER